tara:strand:+ start:3666 stop:3845 length:180 start_codon:yes stop_codon:yes gene_type:complete
LTIHQPFAVSAFDSFFDTFAIGVVSIVPVKLTFPQIAGHVLIWNMMMRPDDGALQQRVI